MCKIVQVDHTCVQLQDAAGALQAVRILRKVENGDCYTVVGFIDWNLIMADLTHTVPIVIRSGNRRMRSDCGRL